MDCIFCKLASGEIPTSKVYEDELILAFKDLDPKAPVHILVIPKEHIPGMDAIDDSNAGVIGRVFARIPGIMAAQGAADGYRVVCNNGTDGGQTVGHLHFHCLAGRVMAWPPG
jgi:histidine triad (HIT) family protein